MQNGLYLVVILIVAGYSVIAGFRRGLTGQITTLLGVGFGIVVARLFTPEFSSSFRGLASLLTHGHYIDFTSHVVCCIILYSAVYILFSIFTGILRGAVSVFNVGMLNRLTGSFFCLFKNMLWISMAYTLMLCINPECGLLRYAKSDDGNMVGGVMWLTPAVTGCYGASDFAHLQQLEEAAKISCNIRSFPSVIEEKKTGFPVSGSHYDERYAES